MSSLLTCLPAIIRPAIVSSLIALVVEVPVCIFLSLWGMQEFAYYISNSTDVAVITRKMWRVSLSPCPPCFCAFLPLTANTEHRLVLYILRRELPARRHPPRYRSTLVSLPGLGVEFPVDVALGDRGDESEDGGSGRLDVLFHHLRRGAGL